MILRPTIPERIIQHIIASEQEVLIASEIAITINCPVAVTVNTMNFLEKRGLLAESSPDSGTFLVLKRYKVSNSKGKKTTGRDKMWRVMRIKRRFTRIDIKRLTELPITSVETYFNILISHGYLRKIGKDGRADVFMLIKDPGPKRPVLRKHKGVRP